jgi:hypothetical protein
LKMRLSPFSSPPAALQATLTASNSEQGSVG